LAELEARYTAKLSSEQVLHLFDCYCSHSHAGTWNGLAAE